MDLTPEDVTAINTAIAALFVLVGIGLTWLVKKMLAEIRTLTGFAIPASVSDQLAAWARMGASYAEEQAHKYANGLIQDGPKTGPQKLEVAISATRSLAPGPLEAFTDKQIAVAVESQLPSIRPPAFEEPTTQPQTPSSKAGTP